ncbi:Cas4 family exonuclease [Arthrobacter phage Lewando]|nr:Cas4 family exonuclease [Arthrobacter phage Lewando]
MIFNEHSRLEGKHSFLSASKYHWINDTIEDLEERFRKAVAASEGTELHELAATMIRKGIKAARTRQTFHMYVNDCIGYRMIPEQILYYSDNAFGTADAIKFVDNKLWIFDLKTGTSRTSMKQLFVYAAYFCLEYDIKPHTIDMEFRIYQNDDIMTLEREDIDPHDILQIMSKIVAYDNRIEELKEEILQ